MSGSDSRSVDAVVAHDSLAIDEESVVLRVEDRLFDFVAGESMNRFQGVPEADRQELRRVVVGPTDQIGPLVAWCRRVCGEARLLDVRGIGVGVLGTSPTPPDADNHERLPVDDART